MRWMNRETERAARFAALALTMLLASPWLAEAQPSLRATVGALTANQGLYENRIAYFTPPLAYTEICFKNGTVSFDSHLGGESTAGGNCEPGDLGWIIEQQERTEQPWEEARQACLVDGMRLPEPFEWKLSCEGASTYDISATTDDWEWTSNVASAIEAANGRTGIGVSVMGDGSCSHGSYNWAAPDDGSDASEPFRCVR